MTNIYSRKMKVYIDIKYYTEMFRAVKLITVKVWKQLKCPFTSKWINYGMSIQKWINCYVHSM